MRSSHGTEQPMPETLPLHERHAAAGARFGDADGWLVPMRYGEPVAEHAAVREGVGVIDRSERGKVEATGRDRASFFHGLLSNDIKGLAPGRGCPTALLDVHGKVTALLLVHCLADRLVLEMERRLLAPVLSTVDRYLFSEHVELEDVSAAWGLLTVAGPDARKTVEAALGQPLPELERHAHAEVWWDGHGLRAVRGGESGEEEFDLWVPAGAAGRVWDRLREAGAQPVGREAWDVLRVEAGVVRHGADVDAGMLLLEAPLPDAYSLSKGCYLGQEVIARVTYRGHVNRKVVGLRFDDVRIPPAGAPVMAGDREVGRVTSAVVSPALRRGVGFAYLRREHAEPGTRVEVRGPEGSLPAEVIALPFYRRGPAG
jgi:folate-binding protein YgfZ